MPPVNAATERSTKTMLADPVPGEDGQAETLRALALAGDRVITAVREMRRSRHNKALQREVYMVGEQELTPVQVDILEIVVGRPHWRMGDVAAALGVDASTATRTISPLVTLGLIARDSNPADRRSVTISATAHGHIQATQITEARRALMRSVLSRLKPERVILLADLMEDYLAAVAAESHAHQSAGAASAGG